MRVNVFNSNPVTSARFFVWFSFQIQVEYREGFDIGVVSFTLAQMCSVNTVFAANQSKFLVKYVFEQL